MDGGVISNLTSLKQSALGVGWRFNLTRRESRIIYLKDGRSIKYSGNSVKNNYYNDVEVESNGGGEILITYIDGSKEYLDNAGLLYKSVDKYGNIINYTYTNGDLTKQNPKERK